MIKFRDFVPVLEKEGGLFSPKEVAPLSQVLSEVNSWITKDKVHVLNIETVFIPNIYQPHEDFTENSDIVQSYSMDTHWDQFVRVWYNDAKGK